MSEVAPDGAGVVFAALADDTRRTVLRAVVAAGSTTATEVAATVPVTRQAVAKHLGVLREAGLVRSARVGRETRYEAQPDALHPAVAWIEATDAAWAARLARLKGRAEGAVRDPDHAQ